MPVTVLLTTSAAPERSPFSTLEKRPPLGVGFLISVLRNGGHRVIFRDPYLRFDPDFPSADLLRGENVELVGIYSSTICFQDTLRMCRRLQEFREAGCWSGRIAVGGPHASVAPETIPEYVDHVVIGEGENLIVPLAEGRAQRGVQRGKAVEDMDALPRLPYDIFVRMPYNFGHPELDPGPIYTLNTSRGCPFACTFCSVRSIWGRSFRAMSAERMVSDVEWLMRDFGARGIYFREDHFTLSTLRTRRFCELILKKGVDFVWGCESRADALDPDLTRLMHRAGCRWLYIGVESGSPRMLQRFNKQETREDFLNAFRWCRQAGIKTYASFVIGAPGEGRVDLARSLKFARELTPDSVTFNLFAGIPYSPLYREAVDKGLVQYTDENGLLYLKGHNRRVLAIYGPHKTERLIPGTEKRVEVALLKILYGLTSRWAPLYRMTRRLVRRLLLLW